MKLEKTSATETQRHRDKNYTEIETKVDFSVFAIQVLNGIRKNSVISSVSPCLCGATGVFGLKRVFVLMLMLAALAGCSEKKREPQPPPPQAGAPLPPQPNLPREELVKKIVERYNELLAAGYRSLNMNPLQEVATPAQAEKVYTHMAALGEGSVRMVSRLKKIDYVRLRFPGEAKAEVGTRELWDFAYTDIKTGAKNEEEKDFPYDVTYTLEKKDGRWFITDVVASSERDAREKMKKQPAAGQGGRP